MRNRSVNSETTEHWPLNNNVTIGRLKMARELWKLRRDVISEFLG